MFVCYYKSWSTKNTFQSKKNLTWFPGKCFPFWLCLFFGKWFPRNHFPNFPVFVCHKKSWWTENTFQSKKNLALFSGKCFPFILDGKHFPEVVKNLKVSYYLLIISNLIIETFDCYIYFVLNIFFQFHPLNLIFILTLVLILIIVICFFFIIF